jgi:hypothetical protein
MLVVLSGYAGGRARDDRPRRCARQRWAARCSIASKRWRAETALTQLQSDILRTLAKNRSETSYLAGGLMLNKDWQRHRRIRK